MNKMPGTSALVIGGSLAGLLAARVLSDYFEQVIIVERDVVHDFPEARKGQAHTRHLHGLLAQGLTILTHYFPDLHEGLMSGGSPLLDMAQSMRWYCYGGYRARFALGLKGIVTSRPFLEWHIRRRVAAIPNVTISDGYSVEKLLTSENQKQITGVQLVKAGTDSVPQHLFADLVIDAGGRGSRSPKWLEEAGYQKPEESTVTCGAGYATRIYERDASLPGNQDWVFVTPEAPHEYRAGAAFPVEHHKWIVSLGGWHGHHAPTDEEGFIAFAKSLPAPDVHTIITTSTPLSDIVSYKFPASLRRHYEKLDDFPEGYLVLGDAVCSFNPLYGQGMTSAAMQAAALDKLLQEQPGLHHLYKPYFRQIARITDIPWQTAVGEDFRFPETRGRKAPGTDLINAYMDSVHRATHHDAVIGAAFLNVMNMLAPPASLLSPRILWRVLKSIAQRRSDPHNSF
ncbi:FAD-binding monooxygenase [Pontibacter sp. 172403-2]|uniref:FAD-dependent oxidoreductase n=1 Tax=Pontibacter rufus TaxID=2791028 RepID=UPI0018AF956D|nr:FAD-binding monooxygenase [Pontibacter sp. 172403-2]MBF9254224.1 FAD-binding monooxygenase [Pontibacter sp. 172403-2]